MRRPKMRRYVVRLDAEAERNLAARAKAHGVSRPEYVRSLLKDAPPGSTPGSEAAASDAWWFSRTPARRVAIWRNKGRPIDVAPHPDQLTMFEEESA